jgi:hypothetical protein
MIRALLDATPPPPELTDVDALLFAFDLMRTARQEILDAMTGPLVISDEDRGLAEALVARDAAWTDALARAKESVRHHRVGTNQLRRYAQLDLRDV